GSSGTALFLMFDEETERLARGHGLDICLPLASLRHRLDSKLVATRLAARAGVATVPHALSHIDSYESLRGAARHLGTDLVVKRPHGDSGKTTFFVSTAEDFRRHESEITAAPEVKIMRRIRCQPATLEACVTRHGTLVGPLLTELTGCLDLTPYRGGWCGNELAWCASPPHARREARRAALALGAALGREGDRGYFGLDLLLQGGSGAPSFRRLHPPPTGATPPTS